MNSRLRRPLQNDRIIAVLIIEREACSVLPYWVGFLLLLGRQTHHIIRSAHIEIR